VKRLDDKQLVARSLRGETEAFGELVKRYQGSVYASSYYYVGRYGVAEDVAQMAFMAAYKGLGQLKDGEHFGPWLKGITSRTAANWLRRHGDRIDNETPIPFGKALVLEDARIGPSGHAERHELGEQIQRAVDALPERYRLIVILRYLQELSYAEIAEFTGESKSEVRGILQKAGRKLRDFLSEWDSSSEGEGRWRPVQK
jgi:RNA polymerase sigma-70 factor (ECF subfamily)